MKGAEACNATPACARPLGRSRFTDVLEQAWNHRETGTNNAHVCFDRGPDAGDGEGVLTEKRCG